MMVQGIRGRLVIVFNSAVGSFLVMALISDVLFGEDTLKRVSYLVVISLKFEEVESRMLFTVDSVFFEGEDTAGFVTMESSVRLAFEGFGSVSLPNRRTGMGEDD